MPKQICADVTGITFGAFVQTYNETDFTPVSEAIPLSMQGYNFVEAIDITWNSDNGLFYAIIFLKEINEYHLATVNPVNGICTDIGVYDGQGTYFSLAYNSNTGILYAMESEYTPGSINLVSINMLNGTTTFLGGPYLQYGEIAYNYDDGFLYYFTTYDSTGSRNPIIYKINTTTFTSTEVIPTGAIYNSIFGSFYHGGGVFTLTEALPFASDTTKVLSITSSGMVTVELASAEIFYAIRGFAYIDQLLPVELTSFTSSVSNNNVSLNWSTAAENNNSGFDIERNVNGLWSRVGNVSGKGTSTVSNNYTFTDRNLASGKYSYRLKQIDFNGNFEYFNLSNEISVGVPSQFEISQNYPNPFNPSTTINYNLPTDGKVSIRVFDMSGKEVATLVNEIKIAGYYSVDFNASSFSSGVYFYSITAGNFAATKKMLLVK